MRCQPFRFPVLLVCVVALVIGAGQPLRADAPPSSELNKELQGLFEEGLVVGPKRLQAAQKRFAAARKLAVDDARLTHAWGLVLLRQSQLKQAIPQFEAALTHKGAPYLPAWQALIWTQLVDRQFEAGLDRLEEYAALVEKLPADEAGAEVRSDAARWMGEMFAALDKTVETKRLRESLGRHEEKLLVSLGDELGRAYHLGKSIVEERAEGLAQQADEARDAAEKKSARKKKDEADKLADNLEGLDKEKENTAKTEEEWKKVFTEAQEKFDKQLESLEKDYQALESRAEAINQTINQLGRDLTAMQFQANNSTAQGIDPITAQRQEQQFMQRQNQLINAQIEYNATIGRLNRTAQQGRAVMQQRAALVKKYEAATGQLVKKSTELEKWSARINDKKKKLDVQSAGKAKGAKTAVDRKVLSLRSYMPFDFEAERERVLSLYRAKVSVPEAVPPANSDDKP
jgi:DNA repair exonuclease SbcCD ATPase subunit